jgi:ABC-type lipoprotein release transport system permease subunit
VLSVRLGARNLARHRWRTGLTLAGIAVSVALMVWSLAFIEGWITQMVRAATMVETGQLEVQTAGWSDKPRPYEAFEVSDSLFAAIGSAPGVAALSPRVELYGLVGHERRSQVARILGVDPVREAETTTVDVGIRAGRWLGAAPAPEGEPREVVVGEGLARQLQVGPGDELVVFAEAADGSLGNDLLRVVGLIRTGTTIDRSAVYLHIEDARFLAALEGRANMIVVRTADPGRGLQVSDAVAARIGARRDPEGAPADELVVRSWEELMPSLFQIIALSRSSYWSMYLLIYLVAAVGILNTQRMSALERRREFGVLIAIGMRPRRVFRTLLVEALVLGFAGAVLGALLGGAVSWWHATVGLDLTLLTDQASFSYMGVTFSDRLYATLSLTTLVQPVAVMLLVAVLSGLWPAWTAARLAPAPTIAGRT